MRRCHLKCEGRRSAPAKSGEAIVLAFGTSPSGRVWMNLDAFEGDWDEINDVQLADGDAAWRLAPRAFRTESGRLTVPYDKQLSLFMLSHPWSGIVQVELDGTQREIDLYSPRTRTIRLDLPSFSSHELSPAELDELAFCLATHPDGRHGKVWTLSPIGSVSLIEARLPSVSGPLDLDAFFVGRSSESRAVDTLENGTADETPFIKPIKPGLRIKDEIQLSLPATALLTFATGPGEGDCIVEARGNRRLVSLDAVQPGELTVGFEDGPRGKSGHFLLFQEDTAQYASLLQGLDPGQPIALYVPRWKGVASSTLNLFNQRLPIPLTSDTPPEAIGEEDVGRYARMLVGTGCSHFVVSGGDLFFIRLIKAVQRVDPEIRFDVLWHSNFTALGEPHDWLTLRQWLLAYADGLVTRFGVVKERYDDFLRAHGIDSVFIKNVIAVDPDLIRPSAHTGAAGMWLSRSDDARKVPYATLFALAEVPGLALKASGLNSIGREIATELRIPLRKAWANPIPRAQLHREMADTVATLYVTLTECSPMLPLESLGLGVPCIVGPSSHLFRHDQRLRDWLVVEDPLDSGLIASKLAKVIDERSHIIKAYRDYARRELDESKAAVRRLLA